MTTPGNRKCKARRARHRPLVVALTAVLGVALPTIGAASSWTVDSCDEGSSGDLLSQIGTLRFVAANAISGDEVDMTSLSCTISLQTGAIQFGQDDLTIKGPGPKDLTISGEYKGVREKDRVIRHYGSGTLKLQNMTVTAGKLDDSDAIGGCIASYANLELDNVTVTDCLATSANGYAAGGGVFTKADLTLSFSSITANTASTVDGSAKAGGVRVGGNLVADYSTIDSNQALVTGSGYASGGGAIAGANASLTGTTVSRNHAFTEYGGLTVYSPSPAAYSLQMRKSTVSGNGTDKGLVGGVFAGVGTIVIDNSTIVDNMAGQSTFLAVGPGLTLGGYGNTVDITLRSSLLSGNLGDGVEDDLSAGPNAKFAVASGYNLVRFSTASGLPGDTIDTFCPLLGPLRDNGGPTWTRALLSGSTGMDKGSNPDKDDQDQRGTLLDLLPLLFPRESGSGPDIGAYEVNQGEIVFNAGFDGCPALPP